MGHNFFKQSQFELFPRHNEEKGPDLPKGRVELKDLTLSVENIILLSIIFVMGFVLFFSFGVERGKKIAQRSIENTPITQYSQAEEQVTAAAVQPQPEEEIDPLKAVEEDEIREVIEVPQVEEIKIPENIFTIQVASFKLERNAKKEAETLRGKGFEGYVIPKGSYSIVCVGKFDKRSEAKQFAGQLPHRYNDYLVRRL